MGNTYEYISTFDRDERVFPIKNRRLPGEKLTWWADAGVHEFWAQRINELPPLASESKNGMIREQSEGLNAA